ncbi:hypothetical protein [Streptomyces sp. G44]|uniref:hypothetical protein n=1 Tax=Streptomyces sp. G44 TaxID=2807632 RepID=UPI001EF92323|nr:hypothetical protein [Streptomyces sp. G44]
MDLNSLRKLAEGQLLRLEGNAFQDCMDRLGLVLFPGDYQPVRAAGPKGDTKNDGYCPKARVFFAAHATRGERIDRTKAKIRSDLEGCLKEHRDVKVWRFLTNDTMPGEVDQFIDNELRPMHASVVIEVWGLKTLANEICKLTRMQIDQVLDLNSEAKHQHPGSGIISQGSRTTPLGMPVEDFTDPYALEVHRPVAVSGAPAGLPAYIARRHDVLLREELNSPGSALIVLVGGSSTGKTRAAYEAVRAMSGWLLHRPIFPSRTAALIEALQSESLAPRTIVWLNELQEYLMTDAGEIAASAIRKALATHSHVKFVATVWPRYWQDIADPSLPFPDGRELLTNQATRIDIDGEFPADSILSAAQSDLRFRMALAASPTRITQYLAAGPALLDFFRDCKDRNPGAWAVLCAAMDGYVAGHPQFATSQFLAEAAPGYLSDEEWGEIGEDWFERALACTSVVLRGAARPLARIRPRGDPDTQAHYRLADYLVQYAQQERGENPMPRSFWDAVIRNAKEPVVASTFAQAAGERGMHEEAARLWMPLALEGDSMALHELLKNPRIAAEEVLPLVHDAIDTVPLSETMELGWMLSEFYPYASLKARLVDRISKSPSELRIGPPIDMGQILEELEEANQREAIRVYTRTITTHLTSVDMSDFWSLTALTGALLRSEVPEANDVGRDLARFYFERHKIDVTDLAFFLAQMNSHLNDDTGFTNEVRTELNARMGEVDITDVISLHPAIVNLFNAGEEHLGHVLITRASKSIDALNLGKSYAPLELMELLHEQGCVQALKKLALRIAEEFDPVVSHAALTALTRLHRVECDEAFDLMARRMAKSGPILPVAGAEELVNFYDGMGLTELCKIYAQRLLDFRRREGAETV